MTVSTTLDASVLIALMNAGDAHHRDAVTLVRRAAIAGDLIAHPLTIAESAVGAAEHGRLQQVRDAGQLDEGVDDEADEDGVHRALEEQEGQYIRVQLTAATQQGDGADEADEDEDT